MNSSIYQQKLFEKCYLYSALILSKTVFYSYVKTLDIFFDKKLFDREIIKNSLVKQIWKNRVELFQNIEIENLIRLSIATVLKSVAESGDFLAYKSPLLESIDLIVCQAKNNEDRLLADSGLNENESSPNYEQLQLTIDHCQLLVEYLVKPDQYNFPNHFTLYLSKKIYTQFHKSLKFCLKDDLKTGGTAFKILIVTLLKNIRNIINEDRKLLKENNLEEIEQITDCIDSFVENFNKTKDVESDEKKTIGIKAIFRTMAKNIESGFTEVLENKGIVNKLKLNIQAEQKFIVNQNYKIPDFKHLDNQSNPDNYLNNYYQEREKEIEKINTWLDDKSILLITILGTAGFGKSSLALKVYQESNGFLNKFWFDVRNFQNFISFAKQLLKQLSVDLSLTESESQLLANQCVKEMSLNSYLLVIDNFEIISEVEKDNFQYFFEQWIRNARNSKIIVTNREDIFLSKTEGSCSLKLEHGLTIDKGVELLKNSGVEGDNSDLEDFVERVDGNPLLIKYISYFIGKTERICRINTLGLGNVIAEHLKSKPLELYRYLDEIVFPQIEPKLYKILLTVSIYKDKFNYDAAKYILLEEDNLGQSLDKLVELSLLEEHIEDNQKYFNLNFIIKQYANLKLKTETRINLSVIYERAINYFYTIAKLPPWFNLDDIKEYLGIFDYHFQQKQFNDALELLDKKFDVKENKTISLDDFLKFSGFSDKRINLYKRLVDEWKILDEDEQSTFARVLHLLGKSYHSISNYTDAVEYYQKSLEMALFVKDYSLEVNNLNCLGNIWRFEGKPNQAIRYHEKALDIAKKNNNKIGEAISFGSLGTDYQALGSFIKAYECAEHNLKLAKELDDDRKKAISFGNMGNASRELGKYKEAIVCYEQSLKISEEIGDKRGQAMSSGNLGKVNFLLEQYEIAESYLKQNLNLAKEIKYPKGQAIALTDLANLYRERKEYDEAIQSIQESLAIPELADDILAKVYSKLCLGKIYRDCNDYENAFNHLEESLFIAKDIIVFPLEANILLELGKTHSLYANHCNDPNQENEKAKNYLDKSFKIRQLIESDYYLAEYWETLGDILCSTKKKEAIDAYQEAIKLFKQLQFTTRVNSIELKVRNLVSSKMIEVIGDKVNKLINALRR